MNKLDKFLKQWKKENNTNDAVYSSYHIDAMEGYAEYHYKTKVEKMLLSDTVRIELTMLATDSINPEILTNAMTAIDMVIAKMFGIDLNLLAKNDINELIKKTFEK